LSRCVAISLNLSATALVGSVLTLLYYITAALDRRN
jgi:hypothetical protein